MPVVRTGIRYSFSLILIIGLIIKSWQTEYTKWVEENKQRRFQFKTFSIHLKMTFCTNVSLFAFVRHFVFANKHNVIYMLECFWFEYGPNVFQ